MAITEDIRRDVQRRRQELESQIKALARQAEEYQTLAQGLRAQIPPLQKLIEDYKKDIPDPTPAATEPMEV